jgi:uncharacterized protein
LETLGAQGVIRNILTMGKWGRVISLALILALSWLAALSVTSLRIDRSDDNLISPDHAGWPAYNQMTADFGIESSLLIYARAGDLWTQERLRQLEDVVIALGDLPDVISVDSIFTATNIRDKGDFVDAGPLVDMVPDDPERIAELRADALYSPVLIGNVISADGEGTAIAVTFKDNPEDADHGLKVFEDVERVIAPLRTNFDPVFQVGGPRLMVEIDQGLFSDLAVLVPAAMGILILTTLLFLRSFTGALIPLATSVVSLLWTLGFMAAVGIPLTLMTAVVPALIIVIGSVEDVHLFSAYLEGIANQAKPKRKVAIAFMARRVGLPILITSLTTAIGFATNAISDIPLIREFAIASAFAMIANLLATILIIPILLKILGPMKSSVATGDGRPRGLIGYVVGIIEAINERFSKWVIGVSVVLLVGFSFSIPDIRVTNDPMSYFEAEHPFVADVNTLHDELSGVQVFSVVLESFRKGGFRTPEGLAQLAAAQAVVDSQGAYDKTMSLANLLALMNQEMHQGDTSYMQVPDTLDDIDLYLLSFQRADLESYVTEDYSRARIVVRHNLTDSMTLNQLVKDLNAGLSEVLGPDISFAATGKNLMINDVAESLVSGQVSSLLLLLLIIFGIFSFVYTSPLAGLLAMVPNLIPVIMNFGLMGMLGLPLNPGTAMVAAIAIGIAIDDTIHLMTRYGAECKKQPNQTLAARNAIRSESVPIMSTSAGLALGFGALTLSEFSVVAQFGALAAATMVYALLADLLIMPILLRHLRLATVWDIVALKINRDVLVSCPLFNGMTRYDVKKVVLLSDIQEFAPGEVIVEQGTVTTGMYVVLQGTSVATLDDGPSRIELGTFQPGQVFGEIGFSGEGVERTATVTATEPSTVVRLDAESAHKGLRFHPRIAARLYRNIGNILGARLGDVNRRLAQATAGT